jgi:predicted nucleic acid-binding protein
MSALVSPREAYLEVENENLREKIKYMDAARSPPYLLQDAPDVLDVPHITETLGIAATIHVVDRDFRYHIVARSSTGRDVTLGYYVDKRSLQTLSPTAAINALLAQLREELIRLAALQRA